MSESLKELEFARQFINCYANFPHNILEKLTELVREKYLTLEQEMEVLISCEQFHKLTDRLFVAKCLVPVYPEFAGLWEKYYQASRNAKKAIYEKCSENVLEFEMLKENLEQFNEADQVDEFFLGKLGGKINGKIEGLLKKAQRIKDFEDICSALKALETSQDARDTLSANFIQDFTDLEAAVKYQIKAIVSDYVEEITTLIKDLQMSEAEERILKLSDILNQLNAFEAIDSETRDTIAELKSSKKDLVDATNSSKVSARSIR